MRRFHFSLVLERGCYHTAAAAKGRKKLLEILQSTEVLPLACVVEGVELYKLAPANFRHHTSSLTSQTNMKFLVSVLSAAISCG